MGDNRRSKGLRNVSIVIGTGFALYSALPLIFWVPQCNSVKGVERSLDGEVFIGDFYYPSLTKIDHYLKKGIEYESMNGLITIGDFYYPLTAIAYNYEPWEEHEPIQSLYISRSQYGVYKRDVLYDFDNDNLVDSIQLGDNSSIQRNEECRNCVHPTDKDLLFQLADTAWKDYTSFLNVEEILAQQPRQFSD